MPLRNCSIISLPVGTFLILAIFLIKKIALFRKTIKDYFLLITTLSEACKEIGVKVSLYQGTKHSSATDLADREGEVFAQQFMGHTSLKMAKRYIKVNPERLRKGLR